MKLKIIVIISIIILSTACSKKDNPFAPHTGPANYNVLVVPASFSTSGINNQDAILGLYIYADSSSVADYTIQAGPSLNYLTTIPYLNDTLSLKTKNGYYYEPFETVPDALTNVGGSLGSISVVMQGYENRYPFQQPVIIITAPQGIFPPGVKRTYSVITHDIYGNQLSQTVTLTFCRISIILQQIYINGGGYTGNNPPAMVAGVLESVNGTQNVIKLEMDETLPELYFQQFSYYSNVSVLQYQWQISGLTYYDKGNYSSLGANGLPINFIINAIGDTSPFSYYGSGGKP